jgi:hypothetical protein
VGVLVTVGVAVVVSVGVTDGVTLIVGVVVEVTVGVAVEVSVGVTDGVTLIVGVTVGVGVGDCPISSSIFSDLYAKNFQPTALFPSPFFTHSSYGSENTMLSFCIVGNHVSF